MKNFRQSARLKRLLIPIKTENPKVPRDFVALSGLKRSLSWMGYSAMTGASIFASSEATLPPMTLAMLPPKILAMRPMFMPVM